MQALNQIQNIKDMTFYIFIKTVCELYWYRNIKKTTKWPKPRKTGLILKLIGFKFP